jgi:hypothetical protein
MCVCRLRGLVFRCVGLCMLLGLLGLIIGARADVQWYRLLAGGYVITRTSLSCLHAAAARAIPRARALCLVNMSAGLMLAVAPAVLAWQPTHAEAYPSHVNVMVVVAVGELGRLSQVGRHVLLLSWSAIKCLIKYHQYCDVSMHC